eukprot:2748187-Heterocapsa_arctica.AAC.1
MASDFNIAELISIIPGLCHVHEDGVEGLPQEVDCGLESEQAITVGIAGKACTLRFQRLKKSKTPMLISNGQLNDLDAIIHVAALT